MDTGACVGAATGAGAATATSGVGSIPHLVMMRLAKAVGVELTHIPYKGGAQAVADVIGGQVPLVLDGLTAAVPHHLIADAPLLSHRRTRAGDAHAAGLRPRTVGLGLPPVGGPPPNQPISTGCDR